MISRPFVRRVQRESRTRKSREMEQRRHEKPVAGTFVAMDSVMQAPGDPDEDRDGGFEHGGWLVPYFDDKMGAIMDDWVDLAGGFLLGRRTYEIFAASWPNSTDSDDRVAAALDQRPKYVVSRTLDKVDWNNSTLLKGNQRAGDLRHAIVEVGQETVVFDNADGADR
jgi:hypothetical protein